MLLAVWLGAPGGMELIIIGIIMVLLFGKQVPKVARSLGSSLIEFKRGLRGLEDDVTEIKKDLNK
jgi:sec-independent protein translocase protein TatA